jgi:hypothetical protein
MLRRVFYSVPSRLIGHRLNVHLYDEAIRRLVTAMLEILAKEGPTEFREMRGHVPKTKR